MISIRPLGFAMALLLALPGGARAGRVCPPASLNEPLPGVAEVTLYQSSVSTAQFPGQWQEGEFGGAKLAYRLFSDGSGTVSSDRQLRGWHVDFTCNLRARSCTYRAVAAPPAKAVETARAIGACLTASVPRSRARPAFPQTAAPDFPGSGRLPPSGELRDRQGMASEAGPDTTPRAAGSPAPIAPKVAETALPRTGAAPKSRDVKTSQSGDPAARMASSGQASDPAEVPRTPPAPAAVPAPATLASLASLAEGTSAPAPAATRAAPGPCGLGAALPAASPASAETSPADQGLAGGAASLPPSLSADTKRLPPGQPQAGLDLPAQCPARTAACALELQPVCWADRLPEEPVPARIQRLLLLAGFDAGPVDGHPGTRTHEALVSALGKDRAEAPAAEVLADLRARLCDASDES